MGASCTPCLGLPPASGDWESVERRLWDMPASQMGTVRRKLADATCGIGKTIVTPGGGAGRRITYHYQLRKMDSEEVLSEGTSNTRIVGPDSDQDYGMATCSGLNFGLTGLRIGETWEIRIPQDEGCCGQYGDVELWTVRVTAIN